MFQISFQTNRSFCDPDNFPNGFHESGVFTSEQASLLEKHGHAYSELADGERTALMLLERQFIEFWAARREPSNIHEQTWLNYIQRTAEA